MCVPPLVANPIRQCLKRGIAPPLSSCELSRPRRCRVSHYVVAPNRINGMASVCWKRRGRSGGRVQLKAGPPLLSSVSPAMLPRYRSVLPLPTMLYRAFRTRAVPSPSRLIPVTPRISGHRDRNLFCSAPVHRRPHKYTPGRIPNAAWPYLYRPFDKMANLDPYFQQVDSLQDKFIERLREAVAIPSISSEDEKRPDVVKVRLYMQAMAVPQKLMTNALVADGPLACGPNQSAWWHRRASRAREAAWPRAP